MQLSLQARKAMAAGLAASTLLWSAAGILPKVAVGAVSSDGCLVLSGGVVWLITGGTRRGFTSAEVFASHGHNFSQVVTASAEDAALPVGPIMTYADGTLVKGPNDPLVYLVANGQKRPFVSGSVFMGLGYQFANIQQAPVNTFQDLPTGGNIDSTAISHPQGTVVNASGAFWLMTASGRMGFPSGAVFTGHGYSFAKVVPANSYDLALANQGDVQPKAPCTSGGGTTPPPTSGSVTLASSNPASSTLVATQAQADLAHFQFGSLGTITSLTFERIGVSANGTLSNVYLFEGSTRLTDAASVGSTDNKVTFAGLNLSTPRTISVRSDILSGSSGQTVGVRLVGYTANSVAYNASVSGNLHTIASATLATVALGTEAGGGATDPGNDVNAWQGTVSVGTRDVVFNRLSLRQIGSITSSDIRNFRLQVDGVTVATVASLDANGYVTFTPGTTLRSGTRIVKVLADVIGGSGRTYALSVRGAYDLVATDSQYNVGIVATGTYPFGPDAANVNPGSLTVVKATDSPSANLVAGSTDVAVGRWTFTAFGEVVKVESLKVGVDTDDTDADVTFRNVRVMVNGSQVGSTTDVPAAASAATGTTFTTNFFVTPGTPTTVEVRADMYDSEGTEEIGAGTLTTPQFALVTGVDNAIPQVSLSPLDVPASNVNANQMTIASGSIALAQTTTYPNQTTTAPQSSYKLASWTLSGNASEAVNVNTLAVGFAFGDTFGATDLTNVYFKYGASTSTIKSTISAGSITDLANSYSVNFTVPANGSVTIELWGTIGSDIVAAGANDTVISYLRATGTTAVSGSTVYADVDTDNVSNDNGSTGQTITVGSGSVTATLDASAPSAQLVDDSGTVTTAAFKIASVTDTYTVTDLTMTIGSCTAVSMVTLKGPSGNFSKACATTLTFSGMNETVAANTNKIFTVEMTMSPIGVGAGTSDSSLVTAVTAFTARDSSGASAGGSVGSATGNTMYAYKALPVVSALALPNSDFSPGAGKVIAKFSVSSNGTGTIAWKQVLLEISKTGVPAITVPTLHNADTGEAITSAKVFQNGVATAGTCPAANTSCELRITIGTDADDDAMEQVSGAKNYEVRATITGGTSADFVSVTLDRNTVAHVAKDDFVAAENAGTANSVSFVWSDESGTVTGSTDAAVTTWLPDFLIKNLPISWNLN